MLIFRQFNREEIEWYGLTFDEALHKQKKLDAIANAPKPLKHTYRQQLLSKLVEDLKTETDREAVEVTKEFVIFDYILAVGFEINTNLNIM